MKIVLDTNIWISGILWRGAPHRIIIAAEERKVEICASFEILQELFGVLQREKFSSCFKASGIQLEDVCAQVIRLCTVVKVNFAVDVVADDPEDNKFLACASAALANVIISGDQHLLRLKKFDDISIVTPARFIKLLKE